MGITGGESMPKQCFKCDQGSICENLFAPDIECDGGSRFKQKKVRVKCSACNSIGLVNIQSVRQYQCCSTRPRVVKPVEDVTQWVNFAKDRRRKRS